MNNMNILILSAGRRVGLVKGFKEALKNLNVKGEVIAVDLRSDAPALYFADKHYNIKAIEDEGYVDDIIRICNENEIKMVIPIMERETIILSQNKEKIEKESNAKVLVSDKETISIFRNKFKTGQFLAENGFYIPRILTDKDLENKNYTFPLFLKPFDGVSSINAFKINNEEELNFFRNYVKEPIIQEFIDGEEYTIDVLVDFEGKPITIAPVNVTTIRCGNISRGKIIKDKLLIDTAKKIIEKLNIIGPIGIDCIVNNGKVHILEINGRFTAHAADLFPIGLNKAEDLIRLMSGEKLSYNEDYIEVSMLMFFEESIYIIDNK